MKVFIRDKDGKQLEIDAEKVIVNEKPLGQILAEQQVTNQEFILFKGKMERREQELQKLWRKIR